MSEFGHIHGRGDGVFFDAWGVGPFVIAAGGRSYRFEDSDRFGPALVKKNGDPLASPWPPERCPFWRAHSIWRRQGRRTEDGIICIWDEPKPSVLRHIRGRNYMQVEAGEEDGATLVELPDGTRIPMRAHLHARRALSQQQGGK